MSPMIDHSPTRVELLAEVRRLLYVALGVPPVQTLVSWVGGRAVVTRDRPEPSLPLVGSPEWWAAGEPLKIASLLVLAEGYLIADPERQVRERLRHMSWDLSGAHDWARQAERPSFAELKRRRAEPGPLYVPRDPVGL